MWERRKKECIYISNKSCQITPIMLHGHKGKWILCFTLYACVFVRYRLIWVCVCTILCVFFSSKMNAVYTRHANEQSLSLWWNVRKHTLLIDKAVAPFNLAQIQTVWKSFVQIKIAWLCPADMSSHFLNDFFFLQQIIFMKRPNWYHKMF